MSQQGQLECAAEATTRAAPGTVWGLLSDIRRWPEWGPWRAAGYRQAGLGAQHGPGAVYWLKSAQRSYGQRPRTVERVLTAEPGRSLTYELLRGIPVRNYLAEVTLTPDGEGTRIAWVGRWDSTVRGRFVLAPMRAFYSQAVTGLAAAADAATDR
jgi:hypothetical protein